MAKKKYYQILGCFGQPKKTKYTYEEYESISHYFKNTVNPENTQIIDDITWNDLDLDEIFLLMNHTYSSVGRDYLYKLLRTPVTNQEELRNREALIRFFDENDDTRTKCEMAFDRVGFTHKISISDHMDRLFQLKRNSNIFHILMNILIVGSILFTIFIDPIIGILMILASFGASIVTYYRIKHRIDSFFSCIRHLVNMLGAAKKISDMNLKELEPYNERLKSAYKTFGNVRRGAWLLSSSQMSGSLADIFLEYFRMFTHADLMKFNSMLGNIGGHKEEVFSLMDALGHIEAMISIASYRHMLPYFCTPEFEETKDAAMSIQNVYHVMIEAPVANSITETKPVLITGSNASGKSTFLRSVAIASILAQTIHTVPADSYKAPFYRIYSSMALKDSLDSGESYYMVEIKSLKRIVDATNCSNENDAKILCFIDEVLRGTNTVERIAASSQILKNLAERGAMCFAATHDIELTDILLKYYSNYHFAEDFIGNEIRFNYCIQEGKATSRNAIRLLDVMGYQPEIIDASFQMADTFVKDGQWGICE